MNLKYVMVILSLIIVGCASKETLQSRLDNKKNQSKADASTRQVMDQALEDLKKQRIEERSLKVGERFPSFDLKNVHNKTITDKNIFGKNPVVVTFYRGGWCPYCNIQLQEFQNIIPDIEVLGAKLVAISPEKPDMALSTSQKNSLKYEVLSDLGNKLSKKLGIVFDLKSDLKEVYLKFGIDLEKNQGNKDWKLPVSATYVVDANGVVVYRYVNPDYTKRAPMSEILKSIQVLSNTR